LDDGTIYRKALYLMVKTMVSWRFSPKPIQWIYLPIFLPIYLSIYLIWLWIWLWLWIWCWIWWYMHRLKNMELLRVSRTTG
jgi:hypothetical protein